VRVRGGKKWGMGIEYGVCPASVRRETGGGECEWWCGHVVCGWRLHWYLYHRKSRIWGLEG